MRWKILNSLEDVAAREWNRLAGESGPFLRHQFLTALERHGCVGARVGWLPCHLVLEDGGVLVAAAPLYLKSHSFGEYVFDWAWADAYERLGLAYYPKLVAAVPFTPVTGTRLLVGAGPRAGEARERLVEAVLEFTQDATRVSSLHWLFPRPEEARTLAGRGLLTRLGCQFHWVNRGYRDFQDFLDALSSKRRKEVRRERREAQGSGLTLELLPGNAVGERDWVDFHRLYAATYDRKWGVPYLTPGFFCEIATTLGDQVRLGVAREGGRMVAGALFLGDRHALYGRNWGAQRFYPSLHYEMCYYQAIEHCIDNGLERFEAGAQGEYKLSRGLLPSATFSAHWLRHEGMRRAVGEFLEREREELERYMRVLARHSAYKADRAEAGAGTPALELGG